jgi:hypothetical protein
MVSGEPNAWTAELGARSPGGFNYISAKTQHRVWTSHKAMMFITVDGPWDVNWVKALPDKSELGKSAPSGNEP